MCIADVASQCAFKMLCVNLFVTASKAGWRDSSIGESIWVGGGGKGNPVGQVNPLAVDKSTCMHSRRQHNRN